MKSSYELRRELQQAEERERLAKVQCISCSGKGWFYDTTYTRAGGDLTKCGNCHGSGLPRDEVNRILLEAFAPFQKKPPIN